MSFMLFILLFYLYWLRCKSTRKHLLILAGLFVNFIICPFYWFVVFAYCEALSDWVLKCYINNVYYYYGSTYSLFLVSCLEKNNNIPIITTMIKEEHEVMCRAAVRNGEISLLRIRKWEKDIKSERMDGAVAIHWVWRAPFSCYFLSFWS